MPKIQAVLFDLDGTLHDRETSLQDFLALQHQRLNLVSHISEQAWRTRFTELDAMGAVWKDKVYQTLVEETGISYAWQDLLADYKTYFPASAKMYPEAEVVMTTLRRRELRLGMITNGRTQFQNSVIKTLGISQYFDVILISESENVQKPDQEIFKRALHRLNISAQETIFIGDNPVLDIEGAAHAGIYPVWRHNNAALPPPACAHAVIQNLDEIFALPVLNA